MANSGAALKAKLKRQTRNEKRRLKLAKRHEKHLQIEEVKKQKRIAKYEAGLPKKKKCKK